jgi:Cu-Zn family superoxide dismutase
VTIKEESNLNNIVGKITFMQQDEKSKLRIKGHLSGLPAGFHGFHVHEFPELGNNCKDAGLHFNPFNVIIIYLNFN